MKLRAPAKKITSVIIFLLVSLFLLTVNFIAGSGSIEKNVHMSGERRTSGGGSGVFSPPLPSGVDSSGVSKRKDGEVSEMLSRLARSYQSGDERQMHSDLLELRNRCGERPEVIKDDFGRRLIGRLIVSSDERQVSAVFDYLFFVEGCDADVVSVLIDCYRGISFSKYQRLASVYLRSRWREEMRGRLSEEGARILEGVLHSSSYVDSSSSAALKVGDP